MKYLTDTHTFIWAISDTEKLSKRALEIIANRDNDIFVSVLSFWEISLKTSIKKYFLEGIVADELPDYAQRMDFGILNMHAGETASFARLPLKENHKDPFDRMIIWRLLRKVCPSSVKIGCLNNIKKMASNLFGDTLVIKVPLYFHT